MKNKRESMGKFVYDFSATYYTPVHLPSYIQGGTE